MKDELFKEIKKLLGLKSTEFIVDPSILESTCDTYTEDGITRCYLNKEEDAIHEGVHAFFEERSNKLWEYLGEKEFISKIDHIVTDEHLEEVTARIIEYNFQNKELKICSEDIQKTVRIFSENQVHYENKVLGKKIMILYTSIYDFSCICQKDIQLYKDIKNDTNPIIVYNKLAKYIGTKELIKENI